jgi:hypothetical protein
MHVLDLMIARYAQEQIKIGFGSSIEVHDNKGHSST